MPLLMAEVEKGREELDDLKHDLEDREKACEELRRQKHEGQVARIGELEDELETVRKTLAAPVYQHAVRAENLW